MAKQEVGLKIDVDVKSVGNMKQELRAATQELIAVNEKFGATSTQAKNAAKRVAELKASIGDVNDLVETFNPNKKFVALGGALQGAVAGFSALQGAIGLFGSESKDVEKILLKVQSAMALQQGISGVAGAIGSMKLLAGTIKTQVVTAFSTLRGAIMATGIGALGIAVALVAANFEEFKKKIFSLIPGLQTAANFIGGLVTKFTDFVGITSEAERNLDKFTKANKRANEGIDAQIKLLEAQGGKEDQVYNLKKQRSENELNALRETLKAKGKLSEEELKQFRDLKNEQQVLDIEESNRKKKLAEDQEKERKAAADKAAQERKAAADKAAQEAKAEAEKLAKIKEDADKVLDDARRSKLTQQQRDEEDVIRKFEEGKKALLLAGITDFKSIEEQKELELAAIRQKYKDEEDARLKKIEEERIKKEQDALEKKSERLLKESEDEMLSFEQRLALIQERQALESQIIFETEEDRKAFIAENEKAITDIKLLEGQARIANAQFAADQLSAIAQIVGQDTAAGKALSIAAATISTYLSAQKAYESQFKPVAIVDSPIRGAIAAGVAVATGIANIRKIMAVPVPARGGGGSGGGAGISTAAPVAPQLAPQVMATQVNTAAVNQMGNRAARAYVLNSDIQNEQQRNAYIDRNASIGNP